MAEHDERGRSESSQTEPMVTDLEERLMRHALGLHRSKTLWGDISHLTQSGSSFPFPWEARTYLPEGEDPRTTLSGEHEVWSADDQIVAEVDARQVADMIAAVGDLYDALNLALEHLVVMQVNVRTAARYDPKWEGAAGAIQPAIDQARAALAKANGRDTGGDDE